jgi:hypothetical protein
VELPAPPAPWDGAAVEFDRVVPPSGNLQVCGKQFWLGPAGSGITVTFWADTDVIHLLIAGARLKSLRSHLSVTDLAGLLRGPAPQPATSPIIVQRRASAIGVVMVTGQKVALGRVHAGKTITIEWPTRAATRPGSPTTRPPTASGCGGS